LEFGSGLDADRAGFGETRPHYQEQFAKPENQEAILQLEKWHEAIHHSWPRNSDAVSGNSAQLVWKRYLAAVNGLDDRRSNGRPRASVPRASKAGEFSTNSRQNQASLLANACRLRENDRPVAAP
jgi:hypothetical protein